MKIALLGQALGTIRPPAESGSLSIWAHQVARRLTAEHTVEVLSPSPGLFGAAAVSHEGVTYRFVPRVFNVIGNRLARRARRNGSLPYFADDRYDTGYARAAARMLRRRAPDVVHLHNFSQCVPAVRHILPASSTVLHMHCEWLTQLAPAAIAPRVASCDAVVGVSDYICARIRDTFPDHAERVHTVYNGTNVPPPPVEQSRSGDPTVLWVGRISPEKGVHTLIDAFTRVAERVPRARLVLVGGDGVVPSEFLVDLDPSARVQALKRYFARPYGSTVRELVPEALSSRIRFEGAQPFSKTPDYYRQATVLVNASLSESFCMPAAEAMAHGVPVVATAVGGVSEVVGDTVGGALVPPDDPAALAEALIRVLSDPEKARAMGGAGRARVEDRFTWDHTVDSLCRLYEGLRRDTVT